MGPVPSPEDAARAAANAAAAAVAEVCAVEPPLLAAAAAANAAAVASVVALDGFIGDEAPRLPPNPLGNSAFACMSLFNALSSVPISTEFP
jgi:hypothetical protein